MDLIRGFVTKAGGTQSFFVAEVSYEGPNGPAATKVTAPGVRFQVGDYFVAEGFWAKEDPKYARRRGAHQQIFKAKVMRPELPQEADAARRWFGAIFEPARHGVTEASIAAFVGRHGAGAALLCERNPELILGISAAPDRHRSAIATDWGRRISGRRAVSLLETCGIQPAVIAAIVAVLRDEAYEAIQRNPYRVAAIKDVGFRNADLVGTHMGIKPEDARRVSAALAETLNGFAADGHTFATATDLGRVMQATFGIPVETVGRYLVSQTGAPDTPVVIERTPTGFIAQPRRFREAEGVVADGIVRMLARGRRNPAAEVDAAIAELCATPAFSKFDPVQRMGVALCSREPVSILTGGPGTGKSAVSKLAVKVAERFDPGPILLCAPTGKAAKRLEETTGREAVTIHRLLGAYEDKAQNATVFKHGRANPLPAGCLVLVDEASMIDATTMRALIEAMPEDGRLMLVGDRNQLPSVDAGAVLADLLRTKIGDRPLLPQTELVNIYRQGPDSRIATGSVLVRNGELPVLTNDFGSGLALSEVPTERICANIEWLVRRALDGDRGFEPRDIMVLAPQRKGTAGTWELNKRLAALVNPDGARIESITRTKKEEEEGVPVPRVGDRVMQTENDAENDVMNGDVGQIEAAYSEKDKAGVQRSYIRVAYDSGKVVSYPASKWRTLQLAYAITIHKSQGSQYPVVIMPVTTAHQGLDRALVYTGWTRAERYLFLVGEREALQEGVARIDSSLRDTRLSHLCVEAAARLGHVPPIPPAPVSLPGMPVRPSRAVPLPAPRRLASAQPLAPDAAVAAPPPEPPAEPEGTGGGPAMPEPVPPGLPPPRRVASARPLSSGKPLAASPASGDEEAAVEAPPGLPRPRVLPSQRPAAAAVPAGPVPRALASQAPRGTPGPRVTRAPAAPVPAPDPVAVPVPPVATPGPGSRPVPVGGRGPVPRVAPQPVPARPLEGVSVGSGDGSRSAPRPRLLARATARPLPSANRPEAGEAEGDPAPGPRP